MEPDDLNPDDLRAVAVLIAADGGPQASTDVRDIDPPGVWVTLSGLDARFRGLTVGASLFLIAPDSPETLDDLADLFNRVKAIVRAAPGLEITGRTEARTVVMPGQGKQPGPQLPALVVPLAVDTVQP